MTRSTDTIQHEGVAQDVAHGRAREELLNSLTAVVGLGLSCVGVAQLLFLSVRTGSSAKIVACTVYGTSLVLLYGLSALYHSARKGPLKDAFRLGDHASIYVLIAGTYTPFALAWLTGVWSWTLFSIIWVFAIFGVVFKIKYRYRFPTLSTISYVAMGWSGVLLARPILEASPLAGVIWTVAGGLIYTVGTLFYTFDELPYFHAVWHVFVLAGSFCHYVAIVEYVIPAAV